MNPEIKKILCPVDFSQATEKVIDYAKLLAGVLNAEIVLLYVSPTMNRYGMFQVSDGDISNFVSAILDGAKDKMDEFLETKLSGVKASGRVEVGYAAELIVDAAETEEADMILMGTHGRKGIDRILFGSVAEKVIKTAKIPVMTIRP